jgi:hypothetical protein
MRRKPGPKGTRRGCGTFLGCLRHFLTPQLFKQARRAAGSRRRRRWEVRPLLLVLCAMTWCSGDSLPERFEVARAFYVALHPKRRRPGQTAPGFLKALGRLPTSVLRLAAAAVRQGLLRHGGLLRGGGWAVFGCDGTELACPRTAELEGRLGPAGGRPGALPPVPQVYVSALVHLRGGLPWSWRRGLGVADERAHLRSLLKALPAAALVACACGYQGYELACALEAAGVAFLIRASALTTFYLDEEAPPDGRDGAAWYWPTDAQRRGQAPLRVRLLRVGDPQRKHDVWRVTNVLAAAELSAEQAGLFDKMRRGSEGFFRTYKRTLGEVKLAGRTVRQVHREAEGSLLAVQLLLAQGAQARLLYGRKRDCASGRSLVLEVRKEAQDQLAGKRRGRNGFQRRLAAAVRRQRRRRCPKVKRVWPTRGSHKPPKPPNLRVLTTEQKALLGSLLAAA